jgi:hypothetical protein
MPAVPQDPDEGFAQMPRAASHHHSHSGQRSGRPAAGPNDFLGRDARVVIMTDPYNAAYLWFLGVNG